VAAFIAFALAAVIVLRSAFERSDLQRVMLDQVVGADRFVFLPNLVLGFLPVILWVALYAALWPFVSATAARPFMVAALVALLPAAIIGLLNAVLPPFVPVPSHELTSAAFMLARVSNALFGVFLAIALWRSGLFSVWVTLLGLVWAGLGVITLGMGSLRPPSGGLLASIPSLTTSYIAPVLLTAFLVLLGLEMLASGACLEKASA
jgi:hypothetical protein